MCIPEHSSNTCERIACRHANVGAFADRQTSDLPMQRANARQCHLLHVGRVRGKTNAQATHLPDLLRTYQAQDLTGMCAYVGLVFLREANVKMAITF